MSFDTSPRNTLCLNNVVTVREEERKYAKWLNLFKIPMSFPPTPYFKIKKKASLIMRKKGVCMGFWGMILFREWYCLFFFTPLFCAHELRTSGGTLTLFIFIDPLSVCVRKREKKRRRRRRTTPPPTQHTCTNTQGVVHTFSSGAEGRRRGARSVACTPLSPSLTHL